MEEQKLHFHQVNLIKRRNFLFYLAAGLGGAAVTLRLWDLQVLNKDNYKDLSQRNRMRIKLVPSPRGSIFDAEGEILATNIPAYDLVINKEYVQNLDLLIEKISFVLGIPVEKFQKIERNVLRTNFLPVPVKSNITYEQMATFSSFGDDFPGLLVENSLIRSYPMKEKSAHLFGFVNWAPLDVLEKTPKNQLASYQKIGQSGVEGAFNSVLIGYDGGKQNEVNAAGQTIRVLDEILPTPGKDIYLSVNGRLQQFIYDTMPYNGATIVSNPNTGDIISMVSKPGFDPNYFVDGIDPDEWQKLLDDEDKTLNDRCLRGTYSPGSTFKPMVALAGLQENAITPSTTFFCPGYYRQGRQTFLCWKTDGHGSLNLVSAIQHSCNVYFYQLGKTLGIETIADYAAKFGFGKKTDIAFPHELSGVLPTPDWKYAKLNQRWLPGETINISIGQGYLTVTPLQLAYYLNGVVTSGNFYTPGVLRKVSGVADLQSVEPRKHRQAEIKAEHFALVQRGMHLCVNGPNGTGAAAKSDILSIGGKTGTTQVVSFRTRNRILQRNKSLSERLKNHGWFIGFTPSEDRPKVSIVVLLENAGTSAHAAAFGKKVLEFYASLDPVELRS